MRAWFWVALVATGCESKKEPPQSSLADEENVRTWANTASAVAVYTIAHGPFAFVDGEETFTDAACPTTEDDGTTVTITGDCTDSENEDWAGTATLVRDGGDLTLTLDAYGHWGAGEDGPRTSGSVTRTEIDALTHEFDVNVVQEGGMTTTVDYAGRIEGGYDTSTVWNGSGTVERDGFLPPTGTVDAVTEDELLDDTVCSGQAVSGSTTISNDDHTVVVTYDGETDCDEDEAAAWSLDGEDQGLVTGVICSAAPGAGQSPAVLGLVALALVGVASRRRRA